MILESALSTSVGDMWGRTGPERQVSKRCAYVMKVAFVCKCFAMTMAVKSNFVKSRLFPNVAADKSPLSRAALRA